MGTIKQGILGGFSGKVGNVIGGSWKGISYMRSRAQSVSNPKTVGQVGQRTKFSTVMAVLKVIAPYINVGYKGLAKQQTPMNAAMSYHVKNATKGVAPDFSMDFELLLASRGNLAGAVDADESSAAGVVTIT